MHHFLTPALDGLVDDLPRVDAASARIAILGTQPMDLAAFPRLRGLFRVGAGTDNIPWTEAAARGIEVGLPSPASLEILYEEVASFASYLVLRMAYEDAGHVGWGVRTSRPALRSRGVLVIGRGYVGRRLAERLAPMMNVRTFDARRRREELREALSAVEVVTLHVPLAENTRGLLGREELACLPDGAAVVNTARGALVDEQALLEEIQRGRLRAAFDVFWNEPYTGPLAAFHPERFHMTPHVAGSCRQFLAAAAADLRGFLGRIGKPD